MRFTGFDVGNFVPVNGGAGGANTTTQSVIAESEVAALLNAG